ncbi:MAG: hypothetical protein ABI947_05215 [Chloroflexota bacterium]
MKTFRSPYRALSLLGLAVSLCIGGTSNVWAAAPGSETLNVLLKTDIPARDPVDLARRLLGIQSVPLTPATPKNYEVGDQEQFSAIDADRNRDFTLTAQLWYKTPHIYMWFETGYKPDVDAVKRSADNFEQHIYPTVHEYFGSEDSPGVDNDVHLYILHARGLGGGIAGYFDSRSQYPKGIVPGSNEHQMFFMNLDAVANLIGTPSYEGVLAHEFQHMVHVNIDSNEQGWVDEGLAELSSSLNGYNDLGFIPTFMDAPITQLDTWTQIGSSAPHYGASYAFMTYFLQRFGEDGLKKLVANQDNGLEGIRSTLTKINAVDSQTGKPITVEALFADWTTTNLLNDKAVGDGRFAYTRFKSRPSPPTIEDTVINGQPQSVSTSQWGTTYLQITQPGDYHLTFEGQPTVKVVPTDPHSGKKMWWSTSFDRSDTRLTHAFDLTTVQKATLSFWLWYATEKDWDYGYVLVSTDNGATWKALATQDSLPADGHNNPYGPAYGGYSGGSDLQSATWRQESADLTPYAGQKILVRFEYLTDDAITERGLLVDDIRVPEINYSTDAESDDGGWQAEGWVRIENALPQQYIVQMAEYSPTPRTFRLLGPADGITGGWDVKVGDDVTKLVISVSGVTEFTVEPAPFQYTVSVGKTP